ncbi:hypothetical protein CR513_10912, partial [Mucuna pruriens]
MASSIKEGSRMPSIRKQGPTCSRKETWCSKRYFQMLKIREENGRLTTKDPTGALILNDIKGRHLKHPINANSIKILTRATAEAPTSQQGRRKARTDPNHEIALNPSGTHL